MIRQKGELKMFGQQVSASAVRGLRALLMSSIAVGAAVAPAQVAATRVKVVTYV